MQFNTLQLHRIFDISLHNSNKHNPHTFALIIGANDGMENDTLGGYVSNFKWNAFFIEPLEEHVVELKKNFERHFKAGKARVAQVAVSDEPGSVTFCYIPKQTIEDKGLHKAITGMSCIYPPMNGFFSDPETKALFDQYHVKQTIEVTTIDKICEEYYIDTIDYVQCDTEGFDLKVLSKFDFSWFRPKVFKVEISNLSPEDKEILYKLFQDNNYYIQAIDHQDALAICNNHLDYLKKNKRWEEVLTLAAGNVPAPNNYKNDIDTDNYIVLDKPVTKKKTTIVTGLWNIKRDQCKGVFARPFEHYLEKFDELLKTEAPMVIFTESSLIPFIESRRSYENTRVYVKEVEEIRQWFEFYDKVQQIRTSPEWLAGASWLPESTQATLEMYNPIVMSKMFLLNDAQVFNPFATDYFLWVDAGITNTVHWGYFTHDKVIDKIDQYLNKFLFVCFPYENHEIHGFPESAMRDYANVDKIQYVARAGVFGGHKSVIPKVNEVYYSLLSDSIGKGLMGTEESIFTIIAHKYPELIDRTMIEQDGLFGPFFENLKNDTVNLIGLPQVRQVDQLKVALYVITYNSPKQFQKLCVSYKEENFLDRTKKYLLDNSSDLTTTAEYNRLCEEYGFEHIKKDNLGICGGRQFIAEHFNNTDYDYYMFIEDDMFLNSYRSMGDLCRNGFPKYIDNLYDKVCKIAEQEKYDFVKFSFTEFFGDNRTQWAWYNVPKEYRIEHFPERPYLPAMGLDPYAPKTKFDKIGNVDGAAYIDGEVYYCNWPQIVSRSGNVKMFLTEKWERPFEQTWMSYMYQETKKGKIRGAVLLASPVTHDRFDHYDGSLRKES